MKIVTTAQTPDYEYKYLGSLIGRKVLRQNLCKKGTQCLIAPLLKLIDLRKERRHFFCFIFKVGVLVQQPPSSYKNSLNQTVKWSSRLVPLISDDWLRFERWLSPTTPLPSGCRYIKQKGVKSVGFGGGGPFLRVALWGHLLAIFPLKVHSCIFEIRYVGDSVRCKWSLTNNKRRAVCRQQYERPD